MYYTVVGRNNRVGLHGDIVHVTTRRLLLKGKVASNVTFGAICNANNSYFKYLINQGHFYRSVELELSLD